MSQALYRKYRPQTFSQVIGQPHIKTTLINQLKSGRISHAYLFTGPRGIGKTTLARLIAKSVNCLDSLDEEPCNKCSACVSMNKNQALDIIEIDAASNTGVDNVRDNIISNAQVAPTSLKYKVFIIDEVHMLSLSAFNALLKTIEEPPENVIFILATTEIHKVPVTIISRCQRYDFQKVSLKEIVKKLEKIVISENIKVDIEVLDRIAKYSEGCARDAESLLGQIMALDDKHITSEIAELVLPKTEVKSLLEFFHILANKQTKAAISHVNQLVEDGIDLVEYNKNFIELVRKILLYRISGKLSELEYLDVDKDEHKKIVDVLKTISVRTLTDIIESFLAKSDDLKTSPIIQLPLELAIIEICETPESSSGDSLSSIKKSKEPESPDEGKKKPLQTKSLNLPPSFTNGNNKQVKEEDISESEADPETLKLITEKMPTIIKAIRDKNHSLALTLSVAQFVAYNKDDTLVLGVKYKFHSDRLCEDENLKIIQSVLEKELNKPVKVQCVVDDKYEANNVLTQSAKSDNLDNLDDADVANVWDLAVNTFGAETEDQKE